MPHMMFKCAGGYYHFSMDAPVHELPDEIRNILLYGNKANKIPCILSSANGEATYILRLKA